MEVAEASLLVVDVLAVSDDSARDVVEGALVAIRRLTAMIDAQRARCTRRLQTLSSRPDADLAASLNLDQRDAQRVIDRTQVLTAADAFHSALGEGAITSGHVDRLERTLRRLRPDEQSCLLGHQPDLVAVAQRTTPDEFARHLRRCEHEVRAEGAEAIFQRQQRLVRLRVGTDDDGMRVWRLILDPSTSLLLEGRVTAEVEARFHGGQLPPSAPTDPLERHSFLRAHALLAVLMGQAAARIGAPEVVAVVDLRGPKPTIDLGSDVDLPPSVIRQLLAQAAVTVVAVEDGRVIQAPGRLDGGRSSRLAQAPQRRALRALYETCAISGCPVRFDRCKIHHVTWWRHGGATDLDNLVPLCTRHHHCVHDDGWQARLDDGHRLTIRYPDGSIQVHTPNRRPVPP